VIAQRRSRWLCIAHQPQVACWPCGWCRQRRKPLCPNVCVCCWQGGGLCAYCQTGSTLAPAFAAQAPGGHRHGRRFGDIQPVLGCRVRRGRYLQLMCVPLGTSMLCAASDTCGRGRRGKGLFLVHVLKEVPQGAKHPSCSTACCNTQLCCWQPPRCLLLMRVTLTCGCLLNFAVCELVLTHPAQTTATCGSEGARRGCVCVRKRLFHHMLDATCHGRNRAVLSVNGYGVVMYAVKYAATNSTPCLLFLGSNSYVWPGSTPGLPACIPTAGAVLVAPTAFLRWVPQAMLAKVQHTACWATVLRCIGCPHPHTPC
jgi:hypothetical protein